MDSLCSEDLTVVVNGKPWELRDDASVHLGMNARVRLQGTHIWYQTDNYGRATLIPGSSYEVVWGGHGNWYTPPMTKWARLREFILSLF